MEQKGNKHEDVNPLTYFRISHIENEAQLKFLWVRCLHSKEFALLTLLVILFLSLASALTSP